MSYSSIPSAWRDIGKAVKKDLVDNIHNNLEDLNSRVTNVEGSISTAIIANTSIKKERDHAPIGTMVWSPLSAAQFATATDDGVWQVCDGSSVSGTDYGTLMSRSVAPDLRGKFLRGAALTSGTTYNPRGNLATDTVTAASAVAHQHIIDHGHTNTFAVGGTFGSSTHSHDITHIHKVAATDGSGQYYAPTTTSTALTPNFATADVSLIFQTQAGGSSGLPYMAPFSINTGIYTGLTMNAPNGFSGTNSKSGTPTATASPTISGSVTSISGVYSGLTVPDGDGNDTSPISVTENCFIKVNKNYITVRTGYLLWRAPQALTINQVVLTPVTQGTSGTLTVDVKKGALGSITTSIFTTTPTLVYTDAVAKTGTLNATNAVVAAGQYVRVDITTTQAKLQEFHILIAATPS